MAVGIGLTVSGAKAVLEGAFGIQTPFVRTPKFSVEGNRGDWKRKKYRGKVGLLAFIELTLGLYFTARHVVCLGSGHLRRHPVSALFQFGFLYTGFFSLSQGLKHISWPAPIARLHALVVRPDAQ